MKTMLVAAAAAALFTGTTLASSGTKPTVVLVHGAFADASSWNGVISRLASDGYRVIAVANPLRSVHGDAQYVTGIVNGVQGPVVLVGHSYGGAVISAVHSPNVRALVYVGAFAPDTAETAFDLSAKFPGSTLGQALAAPVALGDGSHDLYIEQEKFHDQFAADVPASDTINMAAGQRPVTDAALNEALPGEPAWKSIPSWFIYGDQDRNIPPQVLAFMAERAKSRHTEAVRGASHVVMISHPQAVAKVIGLAAATVATAVQ
ncbi:MAG TPA: alpha/beta hydrolase [Povalibacter sp.]|jgi:pimeloyl-ACP methyl ester carboxylesterase|nr:alpha/beta hydrolase [Povalibacter sp.]